MTQTKDTLSSAFMLEKSHRENIAQSSIDSFKNKDTKDLLKELQDVFPIKLANGLLQKGPKTYTLMLKKKVSLKRKNV